MVGTDPLTQKRVLLLHGLEGGPQGHKAQLLRAAFPNFECKEMNLPRVWRLTNPSVAAMVAVLIGGLSGLSSLLYAMYTKRVPWVEGVVVYFAGLAVLYGIKVFWSRRIARAVLARGYKVQEEAVKQFKPDVIVGSSFGGVVALELLNRGVVSCPTLLLCPAQDRYACRSGTRPLRIPNNVPVLIVHGTDDTTVPVADSMRLASSGSPNLVQLHLEPGDDHRLTRSCTSSKYLIDLIRRVVELGQKHGH